MAWQVRGSCHWQLGVASRERGSGAGAGMRGRHRSRAELQEKAKKGGMKWDRREKKGKRRQKGATAA